MFDGSYVHGYSAAEEIRLIRQANILAGFIHAGATFAPGARVLEAGCGVGAQTIELAARNPRTRFVAIDRSAKSVHIAQERVAACGLGNVEFQVADIYRLPFADAEFDGAFLCFVLEHLGQVERGLAELRRVLRPDASVQVFEGDNGSVLAWPDDRAIANLSAAVTEHQCLQGGDANIGRRLCPVLRDAGFQRVVVEPCVAYADETRPDWIEGFTRSTFTDMMKPRREAILECGLLTEGEWREGIEALERTTKAGGTFSYTFFRATALR